MVLTDGRLEPLRIAGTVRAASDWLTIDLRRTVAQIDRGISSVYNGVYAHACHRATPERPCTEA